MKEKVKKVLNSKLFIIVCGILALASGVGAASLYKSSDFSYNSNTLKEALDEIYSKSGPSCGVKIGDYIRMTPTSTSYQVDLAKTGYTTVQTINPSELESNKDKLRLYSRYGIRICIKCSSVF